MTTKQQDLNYIKDYLKSHFQFVLATSGEHPWVATLYYSTDDDLNIYFLTSPKTIHAQHIKDNPKVAASFADSPQAPNSKKVGLQIYGICKEITGARKITHAITLWTKTLNVTNKDYSYQGMLKKAISGRMYKLTPKKIKFFNEELWEEGKEKLIEL
jgi:uncharacterized protein YhbP (UPF0306 family)